MFVLTTEFEGAFALQCQALGFAGARVFVPHPVQNRTTAELHRLADEAFDAVTVALAA